MVISIRFAQQIISHADFGPEFINDYAKVWHRVIGQNVWMFTAWYTKGEVARMSAVWLDGPTEHPGHTFGGK